MTNELNPCPLRLTWNPQTRQVHFSITGDIAYVNDAMPRISAALIEMATKLAPSPTPAEAIPQATSEPVNPKPARKSKFSDEERERRRQRVRELWASRWAHRRTGALAGPVEAA